MAAFLKPSTQKLLQCLEQPQRSLRCHERDKNEIKCSTEKVYRTELTINKEETDNSLSYPMDMMTSIHPQRHPSIGGSIRASTSLQRHEQDDMSTERRFIAWSRSNTLNKDEKRVIADVHYDMTQAMIQSIEEQKENKQEYELLTQATHIEGSDRLDEKDLQDACYWDRINNGIFDIRLDFDYHKWMNDKENYQDKFINEVAKALKVEANAIAVNHYRIGSTWIQIQVCKIWRFYKRYMRGINHSALSNDYVRGMRVQDQISVECNGLWYTATVTKVFDNGSGDGKHFQVRFNPINNGNGKDPFWWNTEWFYSNKEVERLRFPGEEYYIKDDQGHRIPFLWKSPRLVLGDNVYDIRVNDHIFVEFTKDIWRRCVVVKKQRKYNGHYIKVKNLKDGSKKGLNLWETVDRNKISFKDMRN